MESICAYLRINLKTTARSVSEHFDFVTLGNSNFLTAGGIIDPVDYDYSANVEHSSQLDTRETWCLIVMKGVL